MTKQSNIFIKKKWQSQSTFFLSFMPSYSTHRLKIATDWPGVSGLCMEMGELSQKQDEEATVELNCRHVRIRQPLTDKYEGCTWWMEKKWVVLKKETARRREKREHIKEERNWMVRKAKWAQITDVLANKWHGSFEEEKKIQKEKCL